ncbi:conserved hypothetical protein [Acidithiobacillus ferrivorans]|uniref:IstB-like ATP-binding domain-containing protein n=1 Tax=Acidithiobacillus ferrivorans TaxID=160808 RepID=A0A060UL48_9PROT|nr:conserved hypothetical protein [Acidithiobacillus ferrivorans]
MDLIILDDRVNQQATLITSQLPVNHWHEYLGEPTLADAVLDGLLQSAHQLDLKGDSLRHHRDAHEKDQKLTHRDHLSRKWR